MTENKEDVKVMDTIRRWLFPIILSGFMYQAYNIGIEVRNKTYENNNEIMALRLMLSDTLKGITKDVETLRDELNKNEARDNALAEKVDALRMQNASFKRYQFKSITND